MPNLRMAVVIATRGRPEIAARLISHLKAQVRRPDRVVISVSDLADAPAAAGAEVVVGPPGLAAQRNTALRALSGAADIVVCFDDDFVPTPGALLSAEEFFEHHPSIAGATGWVIADGVNGDEISEEAALRMAVAAHMDPPPLSFHQTIGFYGCNMAFRAEAARGLWFDEALPLYGWQEDLDFGARLAQRGDVIWCNAFGGVHRGVSSARPREIGLGYAQIANPAYLMAGGHIPRPYLLSLMARNVAANAAGLVWRGSRGDRKGRLRGNWLAAQDWFRGRLSPARAASL
ncbi:MAG: glycosyltransferase family 2 protein [Pseudomonadota bacterium]